MGLAFRFIITFEQAKQVLTEHKFEAQIVLKMSTVFSKIFIIWYSLYNILHQSELLVYIEGY